MEREDDEHQPVPYRWSNFESDMILGPNALIGLSKNCAGTLRHLHLNTALASFKGQKEFARILDALGELRELRSLMMRGTFDSVGDLKKVDIAAGRFPSYVFPHLERLFVDPGCTINKVFLHALCSARYESCSCWLHWFDADPSSRLPALTWVQIIDSSPKPKRDLSIAKFLSVHGSKLVYLDITARLSGLFTHCTSVTTWIATCSEAGWVSCFIPFPPLLKSELCFHRT
jgi:hypothetical protein